MKWCSFDKQPPENETFLIKQSNHAIYFGRVVEGNILTCHVFQNLAYIAKEDVAHSGKPVAKWLVSMQPQGPKKETFLWATVDWQME